MSSKAAEKLRKILDEDREIRAKSTKLTLETTMDVVLTCFAAVTIVLDQAKEAVPSMKKDKVVQELITALAALKKVMA
jgi:hypothetical protein